MKKIIDSFLLNESIEFKGSITALKEKIQQEKDREFSIKWLSNNEFKFLANVSIGTIMLDYNPTYFDGIKGYATLTELRNDDAKITLTTKLRIEIYILAIMSLIFPFVFFLVKEKLPFWLLFMFPIITIWFWFTYRFQERRLFKNLKKYLEN